MTVVTPLGALIDAGMVYFNGANQAVTIPPGTEGSAVSPTTSGNFYANTFIPSTSSSVLQRQLNTSPDNLLTLPTGGPTAPYNSSGLIFSVDISPINSNSILNIEHSVTVAEVSNMNWTNVYINPVEGVTLPIMTTALDGNNLPPAQNVSFNAIGGISILASSATSPITVAVCVFQSSGSFIQAGFAGDSIIVTEIAPSNFNTMNPVIFSTSSTPVLAFQVPLAASTNTQIFGVFSFFDSSNLLSNVLRFQMVAQQPASGTSTVAQNIVNIDSVLSQPTISFVPSANMMSVYVIGVNGSTFECQYSFEAITL